MRLIIVRHGETEANRKEIHEGQGQGKLTEKGISQAKRVGLRLKDEKIDKIYVSDLQRTIDTAKEIIKYHPDAEVVYDPRIREQSHGVFEGTPWGTIKAEGDKAGKSRFEFKPDGGESSLEMYERVKGFIHSVAEKDKGKNVMMVSHGGPIVCLLIYLFNRPQEDFMMLQPHNTGVSILEIDFKNKHKILTLNCIKHLL